MQQIAELRAEVADLTAKNAALQRSGGNGNSSSQVDAGTLGKIIAGIVEERLRRTERSLREDFVGKFSGILSPLLERLTDRVVTLEAMTAQTEAELAKMDDRFEAHLERMGVVIEAKTKEMSAEVGKHTKTAAKNLAKLNEENQATLNEQREAVRLVSAELKYYASQVSDLSIRIGAAEKRSAETTKRVETAVARYEQLTSETITSTAETAREKIEQSAALADELMESSRRKFRKSLTGLDAKMAEHPYKFILATTVTTVVVCSFLSLVTSLWLFEWNSQAMIDNATVTATNSLIEKFEPVISQISEQTKGLDSAVEDAERWRALTRGMSYVEQQQFFAALQKQAKAQGRSVEAPPSLRR